MRNLITAAAVAALSVAGVAAPAVADDIRLLNTQDFAWESTPEGVAFAPLQGDRFAETYQAMVRLPAGTISPPHVKSANMFGVILQGEMQHYPHGTDAADATKVSTGSFYHIPAGLPHVSACVSAEPCVTYLFQDGAFDFLPVAQ